jgi:DNA-binding response OmpR family regulator
MRILVVEFDPAVRHFIDRVLTRRACRVLLAASVFDAMALLLDFPDAPDVAMLDAGLPGMSGLVYAERLRKQFEQISFVFLTMYADDAELLPGAVILRKPFTVDALVSSVKIAAPRDGRPAAS